ITFHPLLPLSLAPFTLSRNPLCFFFSSRRRHTICYRDWSSDVCSSDLGFRKTRSWRPLSRVSSDPWWPRAEYKCTLAGSSDLPPSCSRVFAPEPSIPAAATPPRSEERRVGKEGRTRATAVTNSENSKQ